MADSCFVVARALITKLITILFAPQLFIMKTLWHAKNRGGILLAHRVWLTPGEA